ncbi:MAG: hypothetical protein RBU37_18580 [Myxococcota bacterium]|nr:hypothetical protein [Myxococcota bacterium]
MTEIVARWEWRSFGASFGAALDAIRASGEPQTRKSDETYIVSRHAYVNTKIRDEKLDIKELRALGAHELEQWYPVVKAGFPLPPQELERVCAAWKVEVPMLGGDELPYELFSMVLVGGSDELEAVEVSKTRHGYQLRGATVEIAELVIAGQPTLSVCVEHADPELVWSVVTELGLAEFENINYVKAIKRQLGWPL